MKLTFLFITIGTLTISANTFSQTEKIGGEFKDVSIREILDKIENETDYKFFYLKEQINDSRKLNFRSENLAIPDFLDLVFSEKEYKYKIFDNKIVVITPLIVEKQEIVVKGKVTDINGTPLPGVNVVEKGITNGAVSDLDGNYTITVSSPDAILSFSYVGFLTEEINAGGQTTIDVVLVEDIQSLEEVVVIGYGTMKKADLTGSIGSVSSESLTVKGTTSPLEAMQGQVAGVNINATTGRPGSGYEIKIRGDNSIRGGNPLYVVDGMVTGDIQFLNPQDIERIDILKDASSTAIYGSRGSNGVVIVTTKQAKELKNSIPSISYNGYYGVRTPSRLPNLMDGDTYWRYREDAYLGAAFHSGNDITDPLYDQEWVNAASCYDNTPVLRDILANKNYTDWQDVMTQNGKQQNHWISISGRSNSKISYVFGFGYQEEEGVMANEWYDRYNFKGSINHEISEKWSAGANFNIALSEREVGKDDNNNIYEAFCLPPVVATYIPEGFENAGELALTPGQFDNMGINGQYNPLITQNNQRDNTRTLNVLGNAYLQYSPLKGLNLKTTFSPYIEIAKRGIYFGSETAQRSLRDPAANMSQTDRLSYVWDNQLTYEKTYNDHKFNFLALHSISSIRRENSYISVENLPFESLWHQLGSATDIVEVSSGFSKSTLVSLLGRLNYSYQDKYLATISLRGDGASQLAAGNKWASFPSVALAWRVSEEGFVKDIDVLSNLKLRASYGYTGNNNIGAYATQRYASNQMYYDFGSTVSNGFAPSNIANAALTWEKTREFNIGLDFGVFANRISGSIDVYNKLSSELLMSRKLAIETGWESVTANIGSVSNKGVEILLNTVNIATKDFTWKTTFSFSKNNNAIEDLYGGKEDDLGNKWFIGEPVNVNYSYVFDGIWQADQVAEAAVYGQTEGQARVKDLDDNDVIDEKDRTIIGTPDPDWSGSFSTSFRYKGFDLNASLYTQQGVQVYSEFHKTYTYMRERWRNKLDVNYYMPATNLREARVSNEYPMPQNDGPYWGNENCGYFKDASFVKVKNISMGYTFNPKSLGNFDIKSLRLYINVLNPFVFSDFDGFDPEWAGRSRFGGGVSTTTYQIGLNVNF